MPILRPTGEVPAADVLVCESTYGNRMHPSFTETVEKLHAAVRHTIEKGGKVLIPAFSLGRTQRMVDCLQELFATHKVRPIPVYVDSPLAHDIAGVYEQYPGSLQARLDGDGGRHVQRHLPAVRGVPGLPEHRGVSVPDGVHRGRIVAGPLPSGNL